MQSSIWSFELSRAGLTILLRDVRKLSACLGCSNMLASRTMTSLTINPFRKVRDKDRISARNIASGGHLRISIVTKYASIRDQSPGLRMKGIESWTHAPISTSFRIPTQRKFDQRSSCGTV